MSILHSAQIGACRIMHCCSRQQYLDHLTTFTATVHAVHHALLHVPTSHVQYQNFTSLCRTSLTKLIHGPYFASTHLLPKRWLVTHVQHYSGTPPPLRLLPQQMHIQHRLQSGPTLTTTRTPDRPALQGLCAHAVLHYYTVNMNPDVQDSICIKRPGSISPSSSDPPAAHFSSGRLSFHH
jgi:hypothetical protein